MSQSKNVFSDTEFARLGAGHLAYLKCMTSDDLAKRFPSLPPMAPGLEIWALFGAAGEPIILSDIRDQALAGAEENELITVTLQ